MRNSLFFRLGELIYRFRWLVIALGGFITLACAVILPLAMTPFQSTGFIDEKSESAVVERYVDKKLGYHHSNQFLVYYHSDDLLATNPRYTRKLHESLADLTDFPIKHDIIFPVANKHQRSKDKHSAYVVIVFYSQKPLSEPLLAQFKAAIKTPRHMTMALGGEAIFTEGVNKQTQRDLFHGDMIAAPVSVIVLILVFGTLVAALVPLCLGGGCALIVLTTLYSLGHVLTLSIFTLNIALLLGLCLSLDYSLFMISRFRAELRRHKGAVQEALAVTLATAGRAVFFSGLAVFISLSALLFFPINILFSIGVGGLTAAFVAVCVAIFLLPALLAVLNRALDTLKLPMINEKLRRALNVRHVWRRFAMHVVHRPCLFFCSSLIVLLCLGYPFLNARFGISDFHILPEHSDTRQFFDAYQEKFNEHELTPIVLILSANKGRILSPRSLFKVYDFANKLEENPLILQVNSIVTTVPRLSKAQYLALYNDPDRAGPDIQALLNTTTRKKLTVIRVVSRYNANSAKTKALISELRQMNPGKGLTLRITGIPVINVDVYDTVMRIFPYAIAWITLLTYLILLVVFRSVFLPFKAILMNILSLSASYGVLVFIFQEGHLHQFLHFEPQGIVDISLLVIVFCAIFGFSMDYEVFLLTRIQEAYRRTNNNELSIIFGIEQSSRIITSAAVIVICICGSFMVADVLMVKEFGLGIAVAIFVDAFAIRSILVPATMVLVKRWNWYLPQWLNKRLP